MVPKVFEPLKFDCRYSQQTDNINLISKKSRIELIYPSPPIHVLNTVKLTNVSFKKVERIDNISVQAQFVKVWMKLFVKQVCKSVQWQEFMTN